MLRITPTASSALHRTLKLEGTLAGPWVEELARSCNGTEADSTTLHLDLAGVRFADSAGIKLLHDLEARGVTLAACPVLLKELLRPVAHAVPRTDAREDASWLARIRTGDAVACEALVQRYAGRMLAVARRLLRSEEESADAVQDAFVAAFRSLDSFEGNSLLGTWLHRIVVNQCLMRLRARRRGRQVSLDELLPAFDASGHYARPVREWHAAAVCRLSREETRAHVRSCIDRLPDDYRTVLLLRDIEGLDTDETARHLGIRRGAVKTRLHRARMALRTLLEPFVLGGQVP